MIEVEISKRWRIGVAIGLVVVLAICVLCFVRLDAHEIAWRIVLGALGASFLVGFLELLNRRYEFDLAVIRYRHRFRWREYPVPRSLKLHEDQRAIYLVDTDSRRTFLIVTREFTYGGCLIDELAEFYSGHGRTVSVVREE